jgi:NTP pyrophosphatase (non-canonical NTP hydrolase)
MKPTQSEIYQCAVKRGKINKQTTRKHFLDAIASELLELAEAEDTPNNPRISLELADVVLVCYSMAQHRGINLDQVISFKHEFNLKRKD